MSVGLIWTGLTVFSALMLVVGYLGYRHTTKSMEDYVLGGRKLGAHCWILHLHRHSFWRVLLLRNHGMVLCRRNRHVGAGI